MSGWDLWGSGPLVTYTVQINILFMNKFFLEGAVGIDEVGRSALAAPIVACVTLISNEIKEEDLINIGVNDSKALTAKKRETINEKLLYLASKRQMKYGIGIVSPLEIDKNRIVQATNKAMQSSSRYLRSS